MCKRILIIGPFPDPLTGVSLANKVVREVLKEDPRFQTESINTSSRQFDTKIGSFSITKLLANGRFMLEAYKVVRNDVIYITPGQTFFGVVKYGLFILLGALLQKEIIVHIHGNYLGKAYASMTGIRKRWVYFLLSRATKGIVLSESLQQNLLPFIPKTNLYVLPNFAESYLVSATEDREEELRIVYLSNLMREKGIIELLEALKVLENQNIPYQAKIAGNIAASDSENIDMLINSLEHTSYLGVVKGDQKKKLLQWSTVFVLPTYYTMEGQPISILEAMASQNVIITTKHAGIPDVFEEGVHGYYVDKKSAPSIVTTLNELLNDPSNIHKIGKDNQHYFKNHFTMKHFKERFIAILED